MEGRTFVSHIGYAPKNIGMKCETCYPHNFLDFYKFYAYYNALELTLKPKLKF